MVKKKFNDACIMKASEHETKVLKGKVTEEDEMEKNNKATTQIETLPKFLKEDNATEFDIKSEIEYI